MEQQETSWVKQNTLLPLTFPTNFQFTTTLSIKSHTKGICGTYKTTFPVIHIQNTGEHEHTSMKRSRTLDRSDPRDTMTVSILRLWVKTAISGDSSLRSSKWDIIKFITT